PSFSLAAGSSKNVARIDIRPRSGRLTTPTSYSHGFRSPSALTTVFSASSAPSAVPNFKMHTSMICSFRARVTATASAREEGHGPRCLEPSSAPSVESHKSGGKSATVFRLAGQVLAFVRNVFRLSFTLSPSPLASIESNVWVAIVLSGLVSCCLLEQCVSREEDERPHPAVRRAV